MQIFTSARDSTMASSPYPVAASVRTALTALRERPYSIAAARVLRRAGSTENFSAFRLRMSSAIRMIRSYASNSLWNCSSNRVMPPPFHLSQNPYSCGWTRECAPPALARHGVVDFQPRSPSRYFGCLTLSHFSVRPPR
jgi:hypothetical protein